MGYWQGYWCRGGPVSGLQANAQGVKCITLPFSATVVKVNRELVDQPDSLLGPDEVGISVACRLPFPAAIVAVRLH